MGSAECSLGFCKHPTQLDELAKREQEAMALLTARAKQSHQNAAAAQSSALASILDGVRAAEEQLGTRARSSLASNTGFLVQLFQASVSPLVDGAQRSLQEMGDQCISLGDKVRGWSRCVNRNSDCRQGKDNAPSWRRFSDGCLCHLQCRDTSTRLSQFERDQAALMNACWEDSAALHKRWQEASQEARQLATSLQQDVHRSSFHRSSPLHGGARSGPAAGEREQSLHGMLRRGCTAELSTARPLHESARSAVDLGSSETWPSTPLRRRPTKEATFVLSDSQLNAEVHVASMQKMLQEYLESVRSCSVDSRALQMVEKATECDGIEASLLSVTSRVKDDSASNVQSLLSDWTAIEEGALNSTSSSLSEASLTTSKRASVVAASYEKLLSVQQHLHQEISDGVASLTQPLSQQHSDQEAMRRALVDEAAERASRGAAAVDALLREADAVVDDLRERVCDHADRAEALCREGGAQANEVRATAASLDVETRGNVAKFRGAVTRFFESDLQEYRPTASLLDPNTSSVDSLRDIVREELRKILPAADRPSSLSLAEVVREEVHRAFQTEAPASVAAPEEPTLTYAAVARWPPPPPQAYAAPPRRQSPAPQHDRRHSVQVQ
ncbi:hypothetical protein HPB47_016841 [Ixodes persulcatus]|uniref:Uncharacterized protein n=1 Tax=Ixodes persulcatus TaxID=34615 RepID=A0AC60QQU6_IXOPE|nr:hypothetical protein HPB47_016841 [Ixodes persulcatus]